jgi:hypothetical protein
MMLLDMSMWTSRNHHLKQSWHVSMVESLAQRVVCFLGSRASLLLKNGCFCSLSSPYRMFSRHELISCLQTICRHVSPRTEVAPWAASVLAYPNLWRHKQTTAKTVNLHCRQPKYQSHNTTSRWLQTIKKVGKASTILNRGRSLSAQL